MISGKLNLNPFTPLPLQIKEILKAPLVISGKLSQVKLTFIQAFSISNHSKIFFTAFNTL